MTQKVKGAASEIEKGIEMILPKPMKIVAKNSLEKELAQLRGYEVPNYQNQRGWTENRDNNDSKSYRSSGAYADAPLSNLANPRLTNLKTTP